MHPINATPFRWPDPEVLTCELPLLRTYNNGLKSPIQTREDPKTISRVLSVSFSAASVLVVDHLDATVINTDVDSARSPAYETTARKTRSYRSTTCSQV